MVIVVSLIINCSYFSNIQNSAQPTLRVIELVEMTYVLSSGFDRLSHRQESLSLMKGKGI